MRRWHYVTGVLTVMAMLAPSASYAQQSLSLHIGWFSPRGEDARSSGDVLYSNLFNGEYSLNYQVSDFRNVTFGAEWLVGMGNYLDAGLGVGRYSETVPSTYLYLVEDDGTEIQQDLKLRIVPFTATVRLLPFGRRAAVQPFIGAGIGVFGWKYSEVGEFIDTFDNTVFQDTFVGSGWSVGPVVLGGVKIPIGRWLLGGEVRYQHAEGELPRDEFLGTIIDLSGFNYLATFTIRF